MIKCFRALFLNLDDRYVDNGNHQYVVCELKMDASVHELLSLEGIGWNCRMLDCQMIGAVLNHKNLLDCSVWALYSVHA